MKEYGEILLKEAAERAQVKLHYTQYGVAHKIDKELILRIIDEIQ